MELLITITMSRLFERFSSKENLKKAYAYVQNELAHSSLSVDPINHPATTAINALGDKFFIALERYLREGKYKPEKGFFVYMPKDNLSLRPICVPSMIDRIVYQAIFNQDILGDKIEGQLSEKLCFANHINEDQNDEYFLSQYFNGWDSFCKAQEKAFKKKYKWKLVVDVQQYYEHIPVERLLKKLADDFGIKDEDILGILKSQLCIWAEYEELPKGIPQGPDASAVLGNVYLSSLDRFAEKSLVGKDLQYFRYADDITIMGKSKEAVLVATEKIVRFLREDNLTLNEKTRLTELEDAESIEAMRFFSAYDEEPAEGLPEDEFTRVQENVPYVVQAIINGDDVSKEDFRELKYFLKVGTGFNIDLILKLIDVIPLRPSLTVPIIKYISEGRKTLSLFGDPMDANLIDMNLFFIYEKKNLSEWTKFWIFKLLVSNKDVFDWGLSEEIERILSSKENSIFKLVCFYYQAIQEEEIDIDQVKLAIEGSKTDVEKSLYSFFLLDIFRDARVPVIKSFLEKILNHQSHELNLIGAYLYKTNPKIKLDSFEGTVSKLILDSAPKQRKGGVQRKETKVPEEFFMVSKANLIPMDSAPTIFGMKRVSKKKTVELDFPEVVLWEKVTIKMKEGMSDVEILYDGTHIKNTDYKELGFFSGKKQEKPDRQWSFLRCLSVLSATDITQATPNKLMPMLAKDSGRAISKPAVYKIKETLTKRLRALFKTADDPFNDNREYYHPKFTILPEADLRRPEVWSQGGRLNENHLNEEDD